MPNLYIVRPLHQPSRFATELLKMWTEQMHVERILISIPVGP